MPTNDRKQSEGKLDMQKIYAKYNVVPQQQSSENDNMAISDKEAANLDTALNPHTSSSNSSDTSDTSAKRIENPSPKSKEQASTFDKEISNPISDASHNLKLATGILKSQKCSREEAKQYMEMIKK